MSRKGPKELLTGRESVGQRMKGRHSDKISQSLDESEKQLRRAREKRARRGAVRLEASSRGQIERAPSPLSPLGEALLSETVDGWNREIAVYADEELRCDPEAETLHQRPDD